jgi:hypothetical protein
MAGGLLGVAVAVCTSKCVWLMLRASDKLSKSTVKRERAHPRSPLAVHALHSRMRPCKHSNSEASAAALVWHVANMVIDVVSQEQYNMHITFTVGAHRLHISLQRQLLAPSHTCNSSSAGEAPDTTARHMGC